MKDEWDDRRAPEREAGTPLTKLHRDVLTELGRLHLWYHESGSLLRGILERKKSIRHFVLMVVLLGLSTVAVESSIGFLFLVGLLLGLGIRDFQNIVRLSRIWPVYEAIIDWEHVQLLSKAAGRDDSLRDEI